MSKHLRVVLVVLLGSLSWAIPLAQAAPSFESAAFERVGQAWIEQRGRLGPYFPILFVSSLPKEKSHV